MDILRKFLRRDDLSSIGAAVLLKRGYHGAAGGTLVECGNKDA